MDEKREEGVWALPPGYSLSSEEAGVVALRRPDGSVVARYAFSAFSPSPEALLSAAEEDLLDCRRQTDASSEGPEKR